MLSFEPVPTMCLTTSNLHCLFSSQLLYLLNSYCKRNKVISLLLYLHNFTVLTGLPFPTFLQIHLSLQKLRDYPTLLSVNLIGSEISCFVTFMSTIGDVLLATNQPAAFPGTTL